MSSALKPEPEDLAMIQGIVVRGYGLHFVVHYILQVKNPPAAKAFVGSLLTPAQGQLGITTGAAWAPMRKEDRACLNIGFTFAGLKTIGLEKDCEKIQAHPELEAFVQGAVQRAVKVGDLGKSSPQWWLGHLQEPDKVHVLLSLHAGSEATLSTRSKELEGRFNAGDAFIELYKKGGRALEDGTVHFGFKDGFAQPNVEGFPETKHAQDGGQPVSRAGSFVLGYPSQFQGHMYRFAFPEQLGRNGSFAAFRILQQDVDAFEKFLEEKAGTEGPPDEIRGRKDEIAARLCGRKRDGTPLIPIGKGMNDFNYAQDVKGSICPFSSHIRRTNPRNDEVAGGAVAQRRIIRRGLPYGEMYDPSKPNDGVERGLLGMFICANLTDQFEFLMKNWINRGGFQGQLPLESTDRLASPLENPENFIFTRGGLYCFLPSTEGLKYIATR